MAAFSVRERTDGGAGEANDARFTVFPEITWASQRWSSDVLLLVAFRSK
jgi:hypothetical protein